MAWALYTDSTCKRFRTFEAASDAAFVFIDQMGQKLAREALTAERSCRTIPAQMLRGEADVWQRKASELLASLPRMRSERPRQGFRVLASGATIQVKRID